MKRILIIASLTIAAVGLLFVETISAKVTCRYYSEIRVIRRFNCERYMHDEMKMRGCYDLLEEELQSMQRICLGPRAGIAGTEYCDLYCLTQKDGESVWEPATEWQKFRHSFGF